MLGPGVADDLGVDGRSRGQLGPQSFDLLDGDALVCIAEQSEPRRGHRRNETEQRAHCLAATVDDTSAVEADRRPEGQGPGDEEAHAAPHAESDHADPAVVEAAPVEVVHGQAHVGEDGGVAERRDVREDLCEVLVTECG